MITDTREKLNEACYFLEQMKEKQPERDVFRYNLSAFLSAARSVTLLMQKEFANVSGFLDWYKRTGIKENSDMQFFNEKRVMTIHIKPVKPKVRVDVNIEVPTANITISAFPPTVIHTKADGTIERSAEPEPSPSPVSDEIKAEGKAVTEWRWYFEELPDKDVVTFCQEHIKKLEAFVAECESLFT